MKIRYDMTLGCIRTAEVDIDGFLVSMTCNMNLRHCTVSVSHEDPMYPDIQYANDDFSICYPRTIVMPMDFDAFEKAWHETRQFCEHAGDIIKELKNKMEQGEEL